jgi:DNA-binding GntR family transcriptional regulator
VDDVPGPGERARTQELLRSLTTAKQPDKSDWPGWLGVSREQVNAAEAVLARQGLIDKDMRALTVSTTPPMTTFTEIQGGPAAEDVLVQSEMSIFPASNGVLARLGVSADTVLQVSQRAVLDQRPLWCRTTYHLLDPTDTRSSAEQMQYARQLMDGRSPLKEAFEAFFQTAIASVASSIDAVRADDLVARQLDVAEGTVVLLRELVMSAADGAPRLLGYTHFRPDRVVMTRSEDILQVTAQPGGYGTAVDE